MIKKSGRVENTNEYDVIFIVFSIWYGCAPNEVNTLYKNKIINYIRKER